MFRYRTNKRALTIAAMIILLCLVCLTGATFALFTSNVKDGTIGVVATAGFIDVDVVDADNTDHSLVDSSLGFQFESNADGKRFDTDSVYFEPGAAFRTHGFKVKNKSSIPIKFRMYISEDDDTDMNAFNEAFEILISTDPTDMTNAVKIIEFEEAIEAETCGADTYYLFIKMKETAGNDFQGFAYEGIGVTVYAVQGNLILEE